MADGTSDEIDATALTGPSASWLGERAETLGVGEAELLEHLVDAYREIEEGDATVETTFDEKIEDVRDRVVQVKRETDGKAAADHEHPELREQTRATAGAVRRLEDEHESLAADVEAFSERVDAGFENFEEVLSYLRDETDDLNRKLTTVAATVLSLRESVASLAGAAARRERVERLRAAANSAGVRVADCGECSQDVSVALLTEPRCPFCGAAFEDVESKTGWFGSPTLVTGEPPALESAESWLDGGDSLFSDDAGLEEMAERGEDTANGDDANGGDTESNGVVRE